MPDRLSSQRTLPAVSEASRPLSPHLQVYKPQLTSGMSIFHRFTGIGLAGGLVLLVAWLAALAGGRESYDAFSDVLKTPFACAFLFAWSWAFFYHLCCGVRHLLWDLGRCLSLESIYASGAVALAVSSVCTLGLWVGVWLYGGLSWL